MNQWVVKYADFSRVHCRVVGLESGTCTAVGQRVGLHRTDRAERVVGSVGPPGGWKVIEAE